MSSSDSENRAENKIDQSVHSWTCHFPSFSSLPHNCGDFTDSSIFTLGNYPLKIRIYPGGYTAQSETTGYSIITLHWLNELKSANICYEISVTINGGKKHSTGKSSKIVRQKEFAWGGIGLKLKLANLLEEIQSDELVVLCEIYGLDSPESTQKLQRFSSLENFLNDEEFSDVKIVLQGGDLYAHKVILSNGSEVFAAMLRHDTKEKMLSAVNIEDIDYDVMLELLRFMYGGIVKGLEKMAEKLLVAADKYCVKDLKSLCEKYLSHSLNTNNVTELIAFSDRYSAKALREDAFSFFKKNKDKIISTQRFGETVKSMDPDLIAELFKCS